MSSNEHYLYSARGNVIGRDEYAVLNKPRLTLLATVTQSFLASAVTGVVFNYAAVDTDGMWDASAPGVVTCKTAGRFAVTAHMVWANSAGGSYRGLWISINNSAATRFGADYPIPAATVVCTSTVATQIELHRDDTIGLTAYQDSVGALSSSTNGGLQTPAELNLCHISTI